MNSIYSNTNVEKLPDSWSIHPFDEMVYFQEGPGIRNWQYVPSGIPFVNIRCLVDGRLNREAMNHISEEEAYGKYKHFLLDVDDYVVSSSGTLGRIATVYSSDLPCMLNTSVIRMRPKGIDLDRGYLKYFLISNYYQQQILAFATGSAQLNYGPLHLRQMYIVVPPLPEQRAIAHILGTLDDKIELNRKRNETLEAMARALFKDWFVDFGPVRAKLEGRDPYLPAEIWDLFPDRLDEEGKPEGWGIGQVSDIGEVVCGKTPSTMIDDFYGDDIPFITIPEMHGKVFSTNIKKRLSMLGANSQKNKTIPIGSICVSCIASPGLVTITTEPSQTNQQINTVIPNDSNSTYYWYWILKNLGEEIKANGSGGSVLSNLSTGRFKTMLISTSIKSLRILYSTKVEPVFNQILANYVESNYLTRLRDTLLPKLISGEVRVGDVDRFIDRAIQGEPL